MAGIPDICTRIKNPSIPYEESHFDMQTDKIENIKEIVETILVDFKSTKCKIVFIQITTWNTHRLRV